MLITTFTGFGIASHSQMIDDCLSQLQPWENGGGVFDSDSGILCHIFDSLLGRLL